MQRHLGTAPVTFIHSDFRLDNLMFGSGENEPAVVTLDWRRARSAAAASRTLRSSCRRTYDVDLRRAAERALVEGWRTGLAAHGADAGSAEEVWADYRRAVLYCWLYPIVIAGSLDAASERHPDDGGHDHPLGRHHPDLDCLSLLPEFA